MVKLTKQVEAFWPTKLRPKNKINWWTHITSKLFSIWQFRQIDFCEQKLTIWTLCWLLKFLDLVEFNLIKDLGVDLWKNWSTKISLMSMIQFIKQHTQSAKIWPKTWMQLNYCIIFVQPQIPKLKHYETWHLTLYPVWNIAHRNIYKNRAI
jgi:hypothetical protein